MIRKPSQDVVDVYTPVRVDDWRGDSPEALHMRGLLPAPGAMAAGSADIQRPRRRLGGDDARA